MLKDKAAGKAKRRESSSGFHYVNLYQCCQRKFYFRYVKGWKPAVTPAPLIFGSAFHEAKAAFYQGESEKKAIQVGMKVIGESAHELENAEVAEELEFRLPHLMHYWVEAFGRNDLVEYKVLAVEKELVVPIKGTPWVMTIRPDTILENKMSGMKFVMETKTSGFSHRLTTEAVVAGDQATAYLWGVKKMLYEDVYAVLPDVAYWNSRSKNLENIAMVRSDVVMRSDYALEMFEMGMSRLFTEVNQKMAAVGSVDVRVLFPRNSFYCLSYSKQCEYTGVCMEECEGRKCPGGLKQERKSKERALGKYVDDSLAIQ